MCVCVWRAGGGNVATEGVAHPFQWQRVVACGESLTRALIPAWRRVMANADTHAGYCQVQQGGERYPGSCQGGIVRIRWSGRMQPGGPAVTCGLASGNPGTRTLRMTAA